ncbi:MAG: ROK family protein [Clostridiales bacterium]|nr:ROK family protein [Clostridiales bacterium]
MYYVGVDLGGTNIKAGVVSCDGKIIKNSIIKTQKGADPQVIIGDIANLIKKIVKNSGLSMKQIERIGIGVPGVVDNDKGVIVRAVNINFFEVKISDELKKYFNIPVYIENDANCAALAEAKFGVAKGYKDSIMVTLGTGIGGGIIINESIYRGVNCAAGELGHMSIVMRGEKCSCGRRGCWEMYASATALKNLAIKSIENDNSTSMYSAVDGDMSRVESRVVFAQAKRGDIAAQKVLNEYIGYLSFGIVNLINIFQPGLIAIGGGISNAGKYFLQKVKDEVGKSSEMGQNLKDRTDIKLAKLGNKAGILGAAFLNEYNRKVF